MITGAQHVRGGRHRGPGFDQDVDDHEVDDHEVDDHEVDDGDLEGTKGVPGNGD